VKLPNAPAYEPPRFIAIEGPIRVGKTSLAGILADRLHAVRLHDVEDNPFLESFYEDAPGAGFQAQFYFLIQRYKQLRALDLAGDPHRILVSDYIFEKDKIFAYLNLNDDELKLYDLIASNLDRNIVSPDLVIYLQSPVIRLMKNIRSRDRRIEKEMTEDYIDNLNDAYNYFFSRYKNSRVMVVNCEEADFVNNQADFENLVTEIFKEDNGAVVYYNPSLRKTAL
jgi:deoxyadenosine/deoxycytidine kinase